MCDQESLWKNLLFSLKINVLIMIEKAKDKWHCFSQNLKKSTNNKKNDMYLSIDMNR